MKIAVLCLVVFGMAAAFPNNCPSGYGYFENRCSFEPCSRSSCEMEEATCMNNYCGGCHAFWYNHDGEFCHECSNYFMDWQPNWWNNFYYHRYNYDNMNN